MENVTNNIYLWLGGGALIVIIIGILSSKRLKAKLSKNGLNIETDKSEIIEKEQTSVKKVSNHSEIDIESPDNRDISVEDIESSIVNIK